MVVFFVEVGEKYFGFEECVKLVNLCIIVEGYKIGICGFINYFLYVDDMIKE